MLPKQIFTIYMNDDLDGISSAAVFLHFINKKFPGRYKFKYELLVYKPDYEKWWKNKKLNINSAVFDFRYHRQAGWWFDHHETSFFTDADKSHFAKTKGGQKYWEPKAKSCCGLVLKYFSKTRNFKFPAYLIKLGRGVDITDSAGYKSAEEAIKPDKPAFLFNQSLLLPFNLKDTKRWVEYLSSFPIDLLIKTPEVRSRIRRSREIAVDTIDDVKNNAVAEGHTVYYISRSIFARYAIYFVFPECAYAVTVSKEKDFYHIGVGANPWNKKWRDKQDIGAIMRMFGGGGHKRVGATEVKSKKKAMEIANKAVEILNK